MEPIRQKSCPNAACPAAGKLGAGNIIGHASFKTKSGPRQRCLCKTCGRSFSANTGTAYFGLRCSRDEFDQVAVMCVEDVAISAIARISGHSRSTIERWIQRAAVSAKRFNEKHLLKFEIKEIQTDELCTFVGTKTNTRWLFTLIRRRSTPALWSG